MQWKKTRTAVLRRRAEAEAHAKAEQVEAELRCKQNIVVNLGQKS